MTLKINNERVLTTPPLVVVFDLDNTLYPYDPSHRAAMTAVETKLADVVAIDPARFRKEFAVARRIVKERLGETASAHNRLLYFQTLLEQLGMHAQVLLALDLEQTYWRAFLAQSRLFDDARDLLRDLRTAGIRTAILTDLTAQIQFRKLVYFGLDQQFDAVVTSEEAGVDKPAREMFVLLFDKLRLEDPAGVWMVGDNPVADIRGAQAHGLAAAQKIHSRVGAGIADVTFEHFIELRRLWKKRFNIGAVPSRLAFSPAASDPRYG